jgi:RNA polymerase sigma-70 factor (ECF subfamily)
VAGTNDEQFECLYEEHFQRVGAYLLSRADRTLAQDALARTFEVAWRRIDDIPQDALPWLFGVARKVLADLRRSQGRGDAIFERMSSALAGNQASPDHAEATVERLIALNALRSLPSLDREALLLVAWDGLTEQQAARSLKCSRGAFALRLYRARRRLNNLMQQDPERTADGEPSSKPIESATVVSVLRVVQTIEESA